MPRHPEARVALTGAEREARRRARKARIEQQRLDALRAIADHPRVPAALRALAREALEGVSHAPHRS